MLSLPYLVSDFNKNLISVLIKQCFGAYFPDINAKTQISYLINYLSELDAKTVVCETEYLDKDYLEDYSNYYVKCFSNYPSRCARLHFFSHQFTHEEFKEAISSQTTHLEDVFKNSYLGFVVIKPLPMTFMGRTCLKAYKPKGESQKYLNRVYQANLFGINLEVESAAFQEQDKVVSACATTALWSLLHASEYGHFRQIPSPSEITLQALSDLPLSINGFPNKGLTQGEVIRALDKCKMKHHELTINANNGDSSDLLDTIQAYIDSNVPIFMGVSVYREKDSGIYEYKGEHAVTVLGYRYEELSSIYLHDDRIGPFVKADFLDSITIKDRTTQDYFGYGFSIRLKDDSEHDIFIPRTLIAATYHKVRISHSYIRYTCIEVQEQSKRIYLDAAKEKGLDQSEFDIKFKIKLIESSKLKANYRALPDTPDKHKLLTLKMPKFIWISEFYINEEKAFDLLFDATDIPQGNAFITHVTYDELWFEIVFMKMTEIYGQFVKEKANTIVPESFFLQVLGKLKAKNDEFFSHLDITFGDLRPPKYIKSGEIAEQDLFVQEARSVVYSSVSFPCLNKLFDGEEKLIWVITKFGYIILGRDSINAGHPTLTIAEAARIGGEIKKDSNGFKINSASGRYAKHYREEDQILYLENALLKFKECFPKQAHLISIESIAP